MFVSFLFFLNDFEAFPFNHRGDLITSDRLLLTSGAPSPLEPGKQAKETRLCLSVICCDHSLPLTVKDVSFYH